MSRMNGVIRYGSWKGFFGDFVSLVFGGRGSFRDRSEFRSRVSSVFVYCFCVVFLWGWKERRKEWVGSYGRGGRYGWRFCR